MTYTRLPSSFPSFPSKSHTLINPNPREMNFPRNIFGSTPDPLPTEDTEATVKASTRSANLVIMDDPFETPREQTVGELSRRVDLYTVVQVRGTPTSGKTTLATLLLKFYQRRGVPVTMIEAWPEKEYNYREFLVEHLHVDGYKDITVQNLKASNVVLILDEAQMSYGNNELWLGFIKTQIGKKSGPRICYFSSYGSSTGAASNPSAGSPLGFLGLEKRISITVSPLPDSPPISLFYTKSEFDDAVRRQCGDIRNPLPLAEDARDYLFKLTNGHPGAVDAIIETLTRVFHAEIKYQRITVGVNHITSALDDEEMLFYHLLHSGFERSFPPDDLNDKAADALRRTLANKSIPLDHDDPGIESCYKNGWLHSEPIDRRAKHAVCIFPSNLHMKFVEHYLTGSTQPFPFHKYPTVEELAATVLKKFSPGSLSSAAHWGTGGETIPVEACYQNEFYRVLQTVLGFSSKVISEWSGGGDCRIDFMVKDPGWGIELLREGDRLGEHCQRFVGNGKYTPWIRDGSIRDWLIIDCRTSQPRPYQIPGTKLWRAVCASDFCSMEILDSDNQVVIPRFSLSNPKS